MLHVTIWMILCNFAYQTRDLVIVLICQDIIDLVVTECIWKSQQQSLRHRVPGSLTLHGCHICAPIALARTLRIIAAIS